MKLHGSHYLSKEYCNLKDYQCKIVTQLHAKKIVKEQKHKAQALEQEDDDGECKISATKTKAKDGEKDGTEDGDGKGATKNAGN